MSQSRNRVTQRLVWLVPVAKCDISAVLSQVALLALRCNSYKLKTVLHKHLNTTKSKQNTLHTTQLKLYLIKDEYKRANHSNHLLGIKRFDFIMMVMSSLHIRIKKWVSFLQINIVLIYYCLTWKSHNFVLLYVHNF